MAADNVVADGDLYQPKALTEFCIRTLSQHHGVLGDLGWQVTPEQLRRILGSCSRSALENIEDCTLEGSNRELAWYTWHLWFKVYVQRYGAIREDTELLPLPGDPPLDYDPPPGMKCPVADYRAMVFHREEAEAARKAAAVMKLRGSYKVEAQKRAMAGTDFTLKVPPPKRGRFSAAAQQQKAQAAALAHKKIAGKPAVKVLHDLGLKKSKSFGQTSSTNKSSIMGRSTSSSSTRPGHLAVKSPSFKQSAHAAAGRQHPAAAAAAAGSVGSRSQVTPAAVGRKASVGNNNSSSSMMLVRGIPGSNARAGQSAAPRSPQQSGPAAHKQQGSISSSSNHSPLGKRSAGSSSIGLGLLDKPVTLAARSPQPAQPSAAAAGPRGPSQQRQFR